jgi:hypothetical protein
MHAYIFMHGSSGHTAGRSGRRGVKMVAANSQQGAGEAHSADPVGMRHVRLQRLWGIDTYA